MTWKTLEFLWFGVKKGSSTARHAESSFHLVGPAMLLLLLVLLTIHKLTEQQAASDVSGQPRICNQHSMLGSLSKHNAVS